MIMNQSEWRYPNIPPKSLAFERKISLLDQCDAQSELNKSSVRGFFNLSIILLTVFFITKPIVNLMDHLYIIQETLLNSIQKDIIFCLMTWPLFFLWSFSSFLLQKLIIRGININLSILLQHISQSGLFIYSIYIILRKNWCSTHAAFVVLQACVHFMKMHSYITVNRDLRQQTEESIKNNKKSQSNYPKNVNINDFVIYMLTPWLVYANYPRKSSINYAYVFRKMASSIVIIAILYLINAEFIQPWILKGSQIHLVELLLRLLIPITTIIILMFYLVFENICNFFAQISKLQNREFYEDWWNSYTFQQFNRKWNKPVHFFLYRHVYLEAILRYKTSKTTAQILTFLFSACLHQLLLAIIFRIVRPIFLAYIIFQVPLIKMTRWMKRSRSGQYLFWCGIIIGPSLIMCSYLRVDERVTIMFSQFDQRI